MVRGLRVRRMDRRAFVTGVSAAGVSTSVRARTSVTVERFGQTGAQATILLLHGSDGLTNAGRYQFAAQSIAAAGYTVLLPRYFEATGDSRARYSEIRTKFLVWRRAIEAVLVDEVPHRVGLVGFSLGGALALGLASRSQDVTAVVNFFGFQPVGLESGRRLPPTLILHGDADRVVPVSNAAAIERLIKSQGGIVESQIYPGDGHGLSLASLSDAFGRTQEFLRKHV
jgi:carboxymethylenebutenolidase